MIEWILSKVLGALFKMLLCELIKDLAKGLLDKAHRKERHQDGLDVYA